MFRLSFHVLICASVLTDLAAAEGPDPATLKSIAVGKSPESVCRGFEDKLYVTLINGDEPGDGGIVAVDGDTVTEFATGMNAPKGLVFVGGYLVTADETKLWKVDSKGSVTVLAEAKDFPHPIEFLNDVAASRDGASVYVAEMSNPQPMFDPSGERKLWDLESPQARELPRKGCVYRVTLNGEITQVVPSGDPAVRFPNGLAVGGPRDRERLFVGDFFSGTVLTYENGKFEQIARGMRGVDGLTVTRNAVYASSWPAGKVWRFDRQSGELKVLLEGLSTAADFFYDRQNRQLIVPDMVAGKLYFLPLQED